MRIYMIGFMGAGKTVVGRQLAARLETPFIDLDQRVEDLAGMTVAEIFAERGEDAFRDLEHDRLAATAENASAVVATGGGVVVAARNRRLLSELGTTVWLDVDFDRLLRRLGPEERQRRPLFGDEEAARRLFEERRKSYSAADLRVRVGNETPSGVAARIAGLIRDRYCAT